LIRKTRWRGGGKEGEGGDFCGQVYLKHVGRSRGGNSSDKKIFTKFRKEKRDGKEK
jgi:hypothetical protein